MAKSTTLTTDWADGTYSFRLPIAQLEEHDEKCGVGPLECLARMIDGTWRVPYVRETIRLGLIGGGMPAVDALKLVRRYVDGAPLIESLPFAVRVMSVTMHGEPDKSEADDAGKTEAAKPSTDPEGSTSPLSDATEQPSA